MYVGPALLLVGALALGACASSNNVDSTSAFPVDDGERLPPVDQPTTDTAEPPPTASSTTTTVPGTRPVDVDTPVLLASDLPGWDVSGPMTVPDEPTWEALDCVDMNLAWSTTGLSGIRSRGTNGGASFRNTAVEVETPAAASDIMDAVDRVWNDCTMFETELSGSFWSEPIEMPQSKRRTAGLVIGNADVPSWTLAYWQIDSTVVILEVEGDEMWTYVDPLMATLSARLDGTPTPMPDTSATNGGGTETDPPAESVPVLVPATPTTIEAPATTIFITEETAIDVPAEEESFPPPLADWTEHPLAYLAPTPTDLGPDWQYQYGNLNEAEPADPDDAIDGCDAPVPPNLDGFDLDYRNTATDDEVSIMVGNGDAAESQIWVDTFRALAACDFDTADEFGTFDVVDQSIADTDDAVIVAGELDFGADTNYVRVLAAARVDGVLVAVFYATAFIDEGTVVDAVAHVADVFDLLLAKI